MKKLLSIICVLTLAFVFTACSAQAKGIYSRAGFLPESSTKTVENVFERAEYSVKYATNEKSAENVTYTLNENDSVFSTELSVFDGDGSIGEVGKKYYRFSTHTAIKGNYIFDGADHPAENDVDTAVYFTGLKDGLSPVFSTRTVKADSLEKSGNSFVVKRYEYTVSTVYDTANKKATVDLVVENGSAADYSLLNDGETHATYTLSGIDKNDYIDNEALLFAPRAMSISSSSSIKISSIDALSKKLQKLNLAYVAAGKTDFNRGDYTRKELDYDTSTFVSSVSTVTLSLSVDSVYSGATQTLTFADSTEVKEYMRLVSMTVPATFNIGTFTFTVRSSEYGTRA